MITLLVICRQNVGRSQMAEGFLRDRFKLNRRFRIASAGFDHIERMRRKYNNRPHPQAIDAMNDKGIDISRQTITRLNVKLLTEASIILVLVDKSELPGYAVQFESKMLFCSLKDLASGVRSSIPFLSGNSLRATRDEIERIVANLAAQLGTIR